MKSLGRHINFAAPLIMPIRNVNRNDLHVMKENEPLKYNINEIDDADKLAFCTQLCVDVGRYFALQKNFRHAIIKWEIFRKFKCIICTSFIHSTSYK